MIKNLCPGKKNAKARKNILLTLIFVGLLLPRDTFAQTKSRDAADGEDEQTTENQKHKKILPEPKYPKVVGYLSFIIPTGTLQNNKVTYNFTNNTKIGFPVGVNVFYNDRFGFSYEFTPTIKTGTLSHSTSMSNLLFDPGPMFRFKHGFTIIPRLAFETSGRYGFTPVFNEVYLRTKTINYFVAMSLPVRWGEDDGVMETGSIGLNVQFGIIFN